MLVGVSWRESLLFLARKETVPRFRNITVSSSTVGHRFYSNKNKMLTSEIFDAAGSNSFQSVELRFAKLTENALTPTRGSKLAAGFDLHRLINARPLMLSHTGSSDDNRIIQCCTLQAICQWYHGNMHR